MNNCVIMTSKQTNLHATPSDRQFRWLSVPLAVLLLVSSTLHFSTPAKAMTSLTTCIDLTTLKERISKNGTCRTPQEALAKWRVVPDNSALTTGSTTKTLTICSNKASSPVTYQLIRAKCAKHMQTNHYTRSASLPAKPVVSRVISLSHESASLALAADSATSTDAPITYYTISSSKGDVKKVHSWRDLTLIISGLQSSTSYTFTVSATNADGTSLLSAASPPVTTQTYVPPAPVVNTAPVAAPAFTLSATAETKTVGTAIAGYSLTSTGGTIASFSISPAAPGGLTFNSSNGLLSGTPTSAQSATSYTITATNASGSATRIFTLTVISLIGTTGPGGGVIFFEVATPFACGPSLNLTCRYLEAAPNSWNGGPDPERQWADDANSFTPVSGIGESIGMGYRNTRAIVAQGNPTSAAALADAYTVTVGSTVVDDWYLPSNKELEQLLGKNSIVAGFSLSGVYWASYQPDSPYGWVIVFPGGEQAFFVKATPFFVRPIRAF